MTIMLFDTPKIVIDQRPIVSSHGNDDFAAFADRHPHGDCYHGYHAAVDDHDDGDYHLELSDRPNRVRRDTSGSSACQFLSHAFVDGGDDDQTDDDCSGADHRDGCDGRGTAPAYHPNCPSPTRPPPRPRSDPAAAPPAPSDSLHSPLGPNASLKYAALAAIGPPARPLEFPAPTVDRAVTLSTNVLDHRSGNVFRASSVLMKRPVHVKSCGGRTVMTLLEGVGFANGAAAARKKKTAATMAVASPSSEHDGYGRHHRSNSGNSHHSMHSWHSTVGTSGSFGMEGAGGATSMSSAAATTQQQQQQLLQQHLQNLQPCGMECELPDRAYCVRRKLCDTTYGSVRLCMVLKRRGRNILGGGVKGLAAGIGDVGIVGPGAKGGGNSGWDSLDKRKGGDQGMFGLIGEPAWETTEEMVAIKVINWSKLQSLRGRHLEDPIKELAAMQLLGNYHPNVISISDSLQDETHLFCIYPFVSGGDLYERVLEEMRLSPTGRMDESLARKWFRQILSALNQLQKKGICHRDLCMENILVDECNNIKIIDFGLCLRVPYADPNNRNLITDVSANTARRLMKAQGQGGTWEYMAPEVLKRDTFDGFAIDLWAVAIVLFELLIGKKPFSMPDAVDANFQYIAIKGDLAGLLRMKGVELEKEAVDLLQKMLYLDPKKRLTLAEVVDHPWVKRGYNGDKVTRMYSVEDLGLRWFINSNPIDDDGPSFGIDPARLRIFSCSSVDHILEKDVEDDDTTANETKSVRSLSPPTHPCQSGACHGSDLNSAGSGTVGIKYDERHLDAEMLDELDELYSNKKRYCITSCLNPRKWWPSQKSSKPGISSINERGSPRNDSEVVHVVQHVDGTIC